MLNPESGATVTSLSSKAAKSPSLKRLAKMDPEIRGFLRAIRDTGLREKAVELLDRQILALRTEKPSN